MFRSSLSSSVLASTTATEIDAVMESTSIELESLQPSEKAQLETKEDKSHKNTSGTNASTSSLKVNSKTVPSSKN